jgi:hypothetical protein
MFGCNSNITFLLLILLLCGGCGGSSNNCGNDYNCGCCNG